MGAIIALVVIEELSLLTVRAGKAARMRTGLKWGRSQFSILYRVLRRRPYDATGGDCGESKEEDVLRLARAWSPYEDALGGSRAEAGNG